MQPPSKQSMKRGFGHLNDGSIPRSLTHLLNLVLPSPAHSHLTTTTPPKMAAASTSTRLTQRDQDHLRDYTIRLTGAPTPPHPEGDMEHISRQPSPSPNLESPSLAQHQTPPGWESSYRQVPPHRPVNRNLDAESRPWGAHGGQSPVIFAMMHGVWLKAVGLFFFCLFFHSMGCWLMWTKVGGVALAEDGGEGG